MRLTDRNLIVIEFLSDELGFLKLDNQSRTLTFQKKLF